MGALRPRADLRAAGAVVDELAAAAALGAGVFVATNLDDVFLLLAFFSDPRQRVAHVVLGQLLGMAALTAASLLAALGALVVPAAYVGLLGVLPLAIGVKEREKLLIRKKEYSP